MKTGGVKAACFDSPYLRTDFILHLYLHATCEPWIEYYPTAERSAELSAVTPFGPQMPRSRTCSAYPASGKCVGRESLLNLVGTLTAKKCLRKGSLP